MRYVLLTFPHINPFRIHQSFKIYLVAHFQVYSNFYYHFADFFRFASMTSLAYYISQRSAKKKRFNTPLTENILLVRHDSFSFFYYVEL